MFTCCPSCNANYRITVAQLQAGLGSAHCQHCGSPFNALLKLTAMAGGITSSLRSPPPRLEPFELSPADDAPQVAEIVADPAGELSSAPASTDGFAESVVEPAPWEEALSVRKTQRQWLIGVLFLLIALAGQLAAVRSETIINSVTIRPWLERICKSVGCQLAAYRDIRAFKVLKRGLERGTHDELVFYAVIVNNAPFAQSLPKLKLLLTSLGGDTVAQRTFHSGDYSDQGDALLMVGEAFEVVLNLVPPSQPIEGYQFELQ